MVLTFKEEKEIRKIERENQDRKHEQHLKEIEAQTVLEKLRFDNAMQLQRIKTAEIRKNLERKENMRFAEDYYKNG